MLHISLNRVRDFKLNMRQIMKNKKGQQVIFATVVAILVVALAIGYFLRPTMTGNIVLPSGTQCRTIEVAAQYLVVGSSSCSGVGNETATCTVQLQNKEVESITAEPVFTCATSSDEKTIKASKASLAPEEIGTFTVSYDNAGLDWTCKIANAKTIKLAEVCS